MFDNKERITTGLVLIVGFVILGVIDYYPLIWLALGAVFIVSFYEAMALYDVDNSMMIVYALSLLLSTIILPHPEFISIIVAMIYISLYTYNKEKYAKELKLFIYPTIPAMFLMGLYNIYGIGSLFWLVAIVASTDSGAYFIGKSIGKTPFSKISPKKTIEGVLGGIVLGTIIGTIIGIWNVSSFYSSFIVSFVSSAIAVFGDLYASLLKREAGVKDSGNIFPGHGGMIDRVDGYFFSVISMFALLQILS